MNWTRKEVKERGKFAFKANYWKCVLVALILMLVGGGGSSLSYNYGPSFDENLVGEGGGSGISNIFGPSGMFDSLASVMVFIGIFFAIFTLIFVIVVLLDVFLLNPLEVGCKRFFNRNLVEKATVNHVGFAFDHGYKNVVKISFFKDLFVFLWTLLFIIPGIVKSYEYMMIPYIISENPDISKDDAFEMSRQMMDGQKWKTFVLDLSFIGWYLLTLITFGIVGIFWVGPYVESTHAALFRKLSNADEISFAQANGNMPQNPQM